MPEFQDGRELALLRHIYSLPHLETLRDNPAAILAEIDSFSASGAHLMNIGPDKGSLIVKLIEERKPSTMIELGGFVGYSAVLFGDAVRAAGGQRYLSLEIDPVNAAVANMMVELAGLRDVVQIVVAPSHVSLARFVQRSVIDHVEILFFDHWKDRYLPDLWLVESLGLMKPGVSVLVADNVLLPGAPEYLDWVRAPSKYKHEKLKEHSFPPNLPQGADLIRALKEGGPALDVENIPGNPDLVYETEITIFERRNGSKVGNLNISPDKVFLSLLLIFIGTSGWCGNHQSCWVERRTSLDVHEYVTIQAAVII